MYLHHVAYLTMQALIFTILSFTSKKLKELSAVDRCDIDAALLRRFERRIEGKTITRINMKQLFSCTLANA
jgi:hypothetical protein